MDGMTPKQIASQAVLATLDWVEGMIDYGHDLGTLRAQIAAEREFHSPRSRRLAMIQDRVQHLREVGAL